ncbi:hypothetical protein BP5796_00920 [Coleophoma crateriformis]|uniref:Zn(2)-C6 fungal-type domain-containing protein n=1 Tax=Coleophoma crateriformis TaxID=565419 RepID=A0A3D8T9G2_9HELO|nr:hypothetical protein BP5796_00920 [Coleophoma crateriformis]
MPPPERVRKITRNRQSLICARCRIRKVRCTREHPECSNCVKVGEICTYGAHVQERVEPPTSKPRLTESALDNTPKSISESSHSPAPNDISVPAADTALVASQEIRALIQTDEFLEDARFLNIQDHVPPPVHVSGHLNTRDPSRPKYLEATFWGLVGGQNYMRVSSFCPHSNLDEYVDVGGLLNTCKDLPERPICDILVRSFLIGVHSIYPLFEAASFCASYAHFWVWCGNGMTGELHHHLVNDQTFLALMISVLYCGAVTAPAELWISGLFKEQERLELIETLKSAHSAGLAMCQHIRHPTLHTLVALLLVHSCEDLDSDSLGDAHFVGLVLRMAQSLGLHREETFSGPKEELELRRRIWWHIVWLDVQVNIFSGTPLTFGSGCDQSSTAMPNHVPANDYLTDLGRILFFPSPSTELGHSSFVLFAIARYETARFEHSLFELIQGTRPLLQADLNSSLKQIKTLHSQLNDLAAQLYVEGIPERGFMASRIADASPTTHLSLYGDQSTESTVFSSWARIMITFLKAESAILLQKAFTSNSLFVNKKQVDNIWKRTVALCISCLRNFIQLVRTPSFSPYRWFLVTRLPPIQPVYLILVHLKRHPNSTEIQLARYFTNEIFQVFDSEKQGPLDPLYPHKPSSQVAQAWNMLKALHARIDSDPDFETPPDMGGSPSSTTPSLDISGLEAWSLSIVGPDDTLALPAYKKHK